MNTKIASLLAGFWALGLANIAPPATATEIDANPAHYRKLLTTLKPGDTMNLAPGKYSRLTIVGLNGTPTAWITIKGPASGAPAIVFAESGYNTVEIINSSYVAIENLRIDSRHFGDAFGISAKGGNGNRTHDIRIEGNVLVGQDGDQQTVGISTKTPTWGWIIRNNQILEAGTGIYLGNSDGTQPFVNGLIENNLIKDTIGYNMEIKDQISIPDIPGMPTEPTSTIIRNNVFIKDDRPTPEGNRPNLLVGAFPRLGTGSENLYEIYGNFFFHNHREALFQGSGRISLHDNIFVDGPPDYPAVVLMRHNFPLRVAYVYNNTVYTSERGIYFETPALDTDAVVGNLVFASNPISGAILHSADNLTAPFANARTYVNSPSFELGAMDFYPRAGKCQGKAIDLRPFQKNADFGRDFNGTSKTQAKGAVVFRGAYAGDGANPGWQLQAAVKPSSGSSPQPLAQGWLNRIPDGTETHFNSFLPIETQGLDNFESGNSTGTWDSAILASCRSDEQTCHWDCGYSRSTDSHATGLLLRQPAARAQQSPAQRCHRPPLARAGGSAMAFPCRGPADIGRFAALQVGLRSRDYQLGQQLQP